MSPGPDTVLVVGGGLAAARCAEALRAGGFDRRIVVACDEAVAPYERPALSKEFLADRRSAAALALRPAAHWGELDVELRLGAAVASVDAARRVARGADGTEIAWDALVVATGARARTLGRDALPRGVHRLRSITDAVSLRSDLEAGRRLVVIGTGFVGLEVASTARALGVSVTIVGSEQAPLRGVFGEAVGALLAERVRGHGVGLRLATQVEGFDVGRDGRVRAVRIAGGESLPCDSALLAIGAAPAAGLVRGVCALAADGGICTDTAGRTDVDGIYACGDVASTWRPDISAHRAIGHWTAAAAGGAAVAGSILGCPAAEPELPFFWSDAFGLRLQHVGGHGSAGSPVRLDAAADGSSFEAIYLRRGRPCAALLANRPRRMGIVRRALVSSPMSLLADTHGHELAAHPATA